MSFEEKKIYHQIPGGRNKFHSAILTTYSFNFHHFEYQTLKTLKHKWIINVGVLVDANRLDDVLGISSGGLKQLTRSYSINGIQSRGAFHPKINFFIGDKNLLLVVGSGNLSPGGQGKNHETFSAIYADDKDSSLIPILNEAYAYLKQISIDVDGFSSRRILKSVPANCDLLQLKAFQKHQYHLVDESLELQLVYNEDTSILKQLISALPTTEIRVIRILSPYFDKNGTLLNRFLSLFPNAQIEVFIPENNGLPPIGFERSKRAKFLKWEETKRGNTGISSPEGYERKLHSKLFSFDSETNSYFMVGSANATIAAFGTEEQRGQNDEFCLLYKAKKRDFFKEMGVYGSKTNVNPNELKRETISEESSPTTEKERLKKIVITSCDLDQLTLMLTIKLPPPNIVCVIGLYDDIGSCINRIKFNLDSNQKFVLTAKLIEQNIAFVQLEDANGNIISNKQVVNSVEYLYQTDPSKENRTIRGVRNALEIGKLNEFELMEYLNILGSDDKQKVVNSSSNAIDNPIKEDANASMTYGEAMRASKNKGLESKITSQHSSVQFWQTINSLLKTQAQVVQDSIFDEEEDGSAESSNNRQSDSDSRDREITINEKKEFEGILSQTKHLSENYRKALTLANRDQNLQINEIVYCQFLLVGHIITAIHQFNSYSLPVNKKGEYSVYSPEKWTQILKGSYSEIMNDILVDFAKVCLRHQLADTRTDTFRQNQLIEFRRDTLAYILLFHFFINKNRLDNPLVESTDLACLTIFEVLGFPDEKIIERLDLVSKSGSGEVFNLKSVKSLWVRLSEIMKVIEIKEGYFFHPTRGVCKIHDNSKSKFKIKSIFDVDAHRFSSINKTELKKL